MPGAHDRSERWTGGFVRVVGDGPTLHRVYVIRRMVGGQRYDVSTRRSTEAEAMVELVRFEKDPAGYDPTPEPDLLGDEGPAPLALDADLSKEYLNACADGVTPKYWRWKKKLLSWWLLKLSGKDLRKLDLAADVLPHIPEGSPNRAPKIATLKHFFSWMANVQGGNLISQSENVLLSLSVPQSPPVQQTRPKTFTQKNLKAALAELKKMEKPEHADAMLVLAATGWHVTELDRLARGAKGTGIEALPAGRKSKKGSKVLLTVHKVGAAPHRTEVGPEAVAAAQRLIARGSVPANLVAVMGEVNEKLGLGPNERVMPGRARHSVATAAVNAGTSIQVVAEFLGHRSSATTRRFYSTLAVAKKIPSMA